MRMAEDQHVRLRKCLYQHTRRGVTKLIPMGYSHVKPIQLDRGHPWQSRTQCMAVGIPKHGRDGRQRFQRRKDVHLSPQPNISSVNDVIDLPKDVENLGW